MTIQFLMLSVYLSHQLMLMLILHHKFRQNLLYITAHQVIIVLIILAVITHVALHQAVAMVHLAAVEAAVATKDKPMKLSWYKYRPIYKEGTREWKYIKTHFTPRVVREVIMEDGEVNIFSKSFKRIELVKLRRPPVEAVKQAIALTKDVISKSREYLAGLNSDLAKISKPKDKFAAHLKSATAEVKAWPAWKQKALG